MMRKILLAILICLSLYVLRGGRCVQAFECVGTATTDCLQCHAVQEGIHTPHWSRQIGIYPNCSVCHCGQEETSRCDASASNTRGPVETVCCASCHDKCSEVDNHTKAHTTTTTAEPTTTILTTTSSTDTTSTAPETSTTTAIEITSSTTVAATTTAIDQLTLCLPCHSECEDVTTSIPVQRMHDGRCRACHPSSALHAQPAHGTCAQCHSGGITRAGNVDAGSCTATCHPAGNPGTCNLANDHDPARDIDCLSCHQACVASTTTTSIPECDIMLTPSVDEVYSDQTVRYAAQTAGTGCLNGVYQWGLDTSINSQIDSDGRYRSGYNHTGQPVIDTITVEDTANHIMLEWPVTVRFEKITRLVPTTLWRSRWVMLPQVMSIQGEGTHFTNERTVILFSPSASVIPSWQTVLDETLIWNYLLVMPSWYAKEDDDAITLTVITDSEVVSKQVFIDQFPFNRKAAE